MPQLIKYLDKIAREKQRAVLCLSFLDHIKTLDEALRIDFEQYKPFVEVTAWLDANGVQWQPCGLQSDVLKHGRIYVDVPFDETDPVYQKLAGHFENPDGSMKIEGVTFYYMPLEEAMKYACQDEPGYWDCPAMPIKTIGRNKCGAGKSTSIAAGLPDPSLQDFLHSQLRGLKWV